MVQQINGLSTHVGIASAAEDLSGAVVAQRRPRHQSSAVSQNAPDRKQLYVGGIIWLVLDRTLVILSTNNWMNTSTSIAELSGTRPRPSASTIL